MDVPGEKLLGQMWETLTDKGIGSLLRPWQTRRENRAHSEGRRHELLMLAQAEIDAADVRAGRKQYLPDGSLRLITNDLGDDDCTVLQALTRIEPKLRLQPKLSIFRAQADAIRNEINQSKAIIYAEDQLSSDTQDPPTEKIDDDWLHIWRDNAGRTSNENIQKLWGSILAGEVISPGSYSLRTLEFLKGLSKQEAELIQTLAPFVIKSTMIWRNLETLEQAGLPYPTLIQLQELGLLSGVETQSIQIRYPSSSPDEYLQPFTLHGKAALAKHPDKNQVISLEAIKLSAIGQQVIKLGHHLPNLSYLNSFGKKLVAMGYSVEIGDYKKNPNGQIHMLNLKPLHT